MSKIKNCRICGGKDFYNVLDMGMNPLVNSLIEKEDLDKQEPVYELLTERCQDCGLVQITNPIDTHTIYRDVDYLYFSSDMPNLKEYFLEYADDIKKRFLKEDDFVVEIGSNDGLMLGMFKFYYKVLGVDPASNTVVRALANGTPTLSDGFSERIAKSIKREFGQAKVIYGNNCIAHIDDIHSLMKGVKELLTDDGVFIVECNYWGGMVDNKNYSLVYHDHFSYFSVQDWCNIGDMYGLNVFDAIVTPAQGGSLRIFMGKNIDATERCQELYKREKETNLNSNEICEKYSDDCNEEALALHNLISKLKKEGATIAGYGAAAKGFSILKLAGIDERHIDYFVDDSPAKQGKYTPVSHIPVISREKAEKILPDYFFITAPNYRSVIVEKEKQLGYKGKFITDKCEII